MTSVLESPPTVAEHHSGGFTGAFGSGRGRAFDPNLDTLQVPACPLTGQRELLVRRGPGLSDEQPLLLTGHSSEPGDWSDWWAVGWVGSQWTFRFCTRLSTLQLWQQHRYPDSGTSWYLSRAEWNDALDWDELPEDIKQRVVAEVTLGIRRQPMNRPSAPLDIRWRGLRRKSE